MVDVFYYDAFQKTISPEPEGGPLVRYSDYAALEARLAERVKVKPLEWSEAMVGRWGGETEGFPFRYTVRINLKGHIRIKTFGLYEVFNGTLDEAFAYVQAAHDRRILSALAYHPRDTTGLVSHETEKVRDEQATPPAPKVTEAMVETEMVRMTISETIRAMGENPDEQIIGELTVFDAVAARVRAALTAAQEAGKP